MLAYARPLFWHVNVEYGHRLRTKRLKKSGDSLRKAEDTTFSDLSENIPANAEIELEKPGGGPAELPLVDPLTTLIHKSALAASVQLHLADPKDPERRSVQGGRPRPLRLHNQVRRVQSNVS